MSINKYLLAILFFIAGFIFGRDTAVSAEDFVAKPLSREEKIEKMKNITPQEKSEDYIKRSEKQAPLIDRIDYIRHITQKNHEVLQLIAK